MKYIKIDEKGKISLMKKIPKDGNNYIWSTLKTTKSNLRELIEATKYLKKNL